jgi:hypothetical protein
MPRLRGGVNKIRGSLLKTEIYATARTVSQKRQPVNERIE